MFPAPVPKSVGVKLSGIDNLLTRLSTKLVKSGINPDKLIVGDRTFWTVCFVSVGSRSAVSAMG